MKYFEKGEIVYLINIDGEDFKVEILDRFYDFDAEMIFYLVEPVEFKGFFEVPYHRCYKKEED